MKFTICYPLENSLTRASIALQTSMNIITLEGHTYVFHTMPQSDVMKLSRGCANLTTSYVVMLNDEVVGTNYRDVYDFLERNSMLRYDLA